MDSWVVMYDISDPKRLRRVARACEDFGGRRQLSVFLMRLAAVQFEKLRSRLHGIIDHREDQVLVWRLCERCVMGVQAMGRPTDDVDGRDLVVVV